MKEFKSFVEKRAQLREAIEELRQMAEVMLPDGYMIAGIGLVETETVEAEYISVIERSSDIWTMDVMKDIAVSADRKYQECFETNDEDRIVKLAIDKMVGEINAKTTE